MLLNILYKHYIDKQDYKGIFKIVSSVKYHFVVCFQICNVRCYFKAFYMVLSTLNDTPKDILFYVKAIFVLNRYQDNSLSEIKFIRLY